MHSVHIFAHTVRLNGLGMADKHGKKSQDDDANPMPAESFREWRKRLGLKQKDAADLLGLKKRMIQYYETGSRSGKHVSIPKSVRLACYALEAGVADYDGENVLGEAPFARTFVHRNALLPAASNGLHDGPAANADEANGHGQPPPLPMSETGRD
jgi:transcriptional regulator with XRE-family HTH domain